jgi:purine catabolism regulator
MNESTLHILLETGEGMNFKGMTVKELLRLPILKDAKLLGGEKGLDRIVRFIDIMEVPDVKEWLREGELILTTGYSIRHDPTLLLDLVEQLALAGAAALGIKPERFLSDIPQEMIDKSNEYQLPIIQIPIGTPYIDITYTVMEQILDRQAVLLRRSEEVYKALTNLVLNNSGIQVMADNVAGLVKSPIRVIGNKGEVLVSSPADAVYRPSHKTRHWDITVDKQYIGKLIVEKEQLDELELIYIEQARLVFSLELMRRKIAHDTEVRLRGNFFEELLMGLPLSRQEVENKGRLLELLPEWLWEVCMIEGDIHLFDEQSPFLTELHEIIHRESGNRRVRSHVQRQGDRLILLLSNKAEEPVRKQHPGNEVLKDWVQILTPMLKRWSKIRSGFGSKRSLWEVHRSYVEAKIAITIGSRLNKDQQMYTFEEVEMFHLLLEASDYVNFETLIEKKIGKLSLYDKENGTDLVTTFYYYLATGGSLIETANRLYVHRNSVKYRMDRVKEISGIDLDNALNRSVYYLCTAFYLLKKMD